MLRPIVISANPEAGIAREFVALAEQLSGLVPTLVVGKDEAALLPKDCAGVIGYGMWKLHEACLERDIPVYMIGPVGLGEEEEWDLDHDVQGYVMHEPGSDWRKLLRSRISNLLQERALAAQLAFSEQLPEEQREKLTKWPAEIMGLSGRKYLFEEFLGTGGTAVVAKVSDEARTIFAAKAPSAHRFPIETTANRFAREAEILASIGHQNIVEVVDQAKIGPEPVIVMEYLEGGTLYERLLARGRPKAEVSMEWLAQALAGVAELHRLHIVHRDLTPRNLLFRGDGMLVISDFGTVRYLDDATLTNSTDQLGSLIYIAPEQFSDPHAARPEADVYSIGQIAFLLFTGIAPQGNTGPLQVHAADVPAEVAAVVESCRAFDPNDRPADAGEALRELDGAMRTAEDRRRAWRPTIELCEELFDPLAVAAKRLREDEQYPPTPHGMAIELLGRIRDSTVKTIAYLQECRQRGRQFVTVQRPGDEAALPGETVAVVLGPRLRVRTNAEEQLVWTAWHEGSDELIIQLAEWREQLLEGEVVLLPRTFDNKGEMLFHPYDHSIDLDPVLELVLGA